MFLTIIEASETSGVQAFEETSLIEAIKDRSYEIVTALFKKEYDIDETDSSYLSPLHHAVMINENKIVEYLVDRGADVNAADFYERTPLLYA